MVSLGNFFLLVVIMSLGFMCASQLAEIDHQNDETKVVQKLESDLSDQSQETEAKLENSPEVGVVSIEKKEHNHNNPNNNPNKEENHEDLDPVKLEGKEIWPEEDSKKKMDDKESKNEVGSSQGKSNHGHKHDENRIIHHGSHTHTEAVIIII